MLFEKHYLPTRDEIEEAGLALALECHLTAVRQIVTTRQPVGAMRRNLLATLQELHRMLADVAAATSR